MTLFPDLNVEETKINVKILLSQYRRMQRLVTEGHMPKITQTYTLEPRSASLDNDQTFDSVSRKMTAEDELTKIAEALNKLNAYHRQLVYYRYMVKERMTDEDISGIMSMSERTYYRELETTLIEFAEAYDGGSLLSDK